MSDVSIPDANVVFNRFYILLYLVRNLICPSWTIKDVVFRLKLFIKDDVISFTITSRINDFSENILVKIVCWSAR